MRYASTKSPAAAVELSRAIAEGLAPDGGLYVPVAFPEHHVDDFAGLEGIAEIGERVLRPFFAGDVLAPRLDEICRAALDFPVPLRPLARDTAVLELFHGPTAAFKDFGARFLAECFQRMERADASRPRTILVATSGDTGSAVAAAFHRKPGVEVVILFPLGGVSGRQRHLLSCWDDNVQSFAVRGSFDDCQALVKAAFRDERLARARDLTSANSINIGRLLPQVVYYAAAAQWYTRRFGETPGMIVPSGNLGNSIGAFWARRIGFPIRHVALATNANRVVADWFETGEWRPREALRTLANAMDVGNPSNFERLRALHGGIDETRRHASTLSVDDDAIREELRRGPERWGETWCPHTATAVRLRERLDSPHWIVVATAHPAKFDSIVEPLIGRKLDVPPALREQLARPARCAEIDPELDELRRHLEA